MSQQLEDDLCRHLGERIHRLIEDHCDTCDRMGVEREKALDMAIAMLLGRVKAVVKAEGGDDDDMRQLCLFVLQGSATR